MKMSRIVEGMVDHPKQTLAIVWFFGAAVLFGLMILCSVYGVFGKSSAEVAESAQQSVNIERAWNWFIPTIFPTLSLIASAFIHDAVQKKNYKAESSKSLFLLTISVSLFYIFAILGTIFTVNPAQNHLVYPVEWLEISNVWLTPLQGLTVGVMGAYFMHRAPEKHETPDSGQPGNEQNTGSGHPAPTGLETGAGTQHSDEKPNVSGKAAAEKLTDGNQDTSEDQSGERSQWGDGSAAENVTRETLPSQDKPAST